MSTPAANRSFISSLTRRRVREREFSGLAVVVVLRLLRHRERAGQRHLDGLVGVRFEERDERSFDGCATAHRPDDARHRNRLSGAVDCFAGPVEVHAVERVREQIRVALPAHLAVCHHVDARADLIEQRDERRVALCFFEMLGRRATTPSRARAAAVARRVGPVDQPIRLCVAADQHHRQQWAHAIRHQASSALALRFVAHLNGDA